MANLQDLSFWIDLSGTPAPSLPQHAFRELTALVVRGQTDHLVAFILACRFPSLTRIKLWTTRPSGTRKLRDAFTAVSQRCDPALLTSFAAYFQHNFALRPDSLMEFSEPLLVFPNIASFNLLFFETEPSVRDDDLARLGTAWPRLASFHVRHRTGVFSQRDLARPTLSGIIKLARRCPDLATIYIPELDPGSLPGPGTGAGPPFRHGLRTVCIDNIMPPAGFRLYLDVATVLDRTFPVLDLAEMRKMYVAYLQGKGWEEVLRLLEAMQVGRENGRISGRGTASTEEAIMPG